MLDLLVKHTLDTRAHMSHDMLRSIKRETVGKHTADVGDELVRGLVMWVLRIWLGGVGGCKLAFDGAKVHRVLDDGRVVRDVEGDRIHGPEKGSRILELLQCPNCRATELPLRHGERDRAAFWCGW
jgi:hypothetical protein